MSIFSTGVRALCSGRGPIAQRAVRTAPMLSYQRKFSWRGAAAPPFAGQDHVGGHHQGHLHHIGALAGWRPRALSRGAPRASLSTTASTADAPLLDDEQRELIRLIKRELLELQSTIASLDKGGSADGEAARSDGDILSECLLHLDDFFFVVCVGEFNAGKSSLINALLGGRHLAEGVTPTTDAVCLLRGGGGGGAGDDDGEAPGTTTTQTTDEQGLRVLNLPVPWLAESGVTIVDTPGTNALAELGHDRLAEDIVPRCDLVLFLTSSDRPLSESERAFLRRIHRWRKKVVLVVNKADLLANEPGGLEQVEGFVATHARELLGRDVELFSVSARAALRHKLGEADAGAADDDDAVARFRALEEYLVSSLTRGGARVRWKLENPLGVAEELAAANAARVARRRKAVASDERALGELDGQLEAYRRDAKRDLRLHQARVDRVLNDMVERADAFVEDRLTLFGGDGGAAGPGGEEDGPWRSPLRLLKGAALERDFQRVVVARTADQIENMVRDTAEWIVARNEREGRAVADFLRARVSDHRRGSNNSRVVVGDVGMGPRGGDGGWDNARDKLLNRMLNTTHVLVGGNGGGKGKGVGEGGGDVVDVVDGSAAAAGLGFDKKGESERIASAAQTALFAALSLEAGALSVGGASVASLLAGGALLDWTGVGAASALALAGFYVLPWKRGQAKAHFRTQVAELRGVLGQALARHADAEVDRALARMREGVGPWARFVEGEAALLREGGARLEKTGAALAALRARVASIGARGDDGGGGGGN